MGRLDGKVALISGGARGIGAAIARRFLAEGAKTVVGDVLDDDGARLLQELGEGVRFVHLDVTQPADWDAAVQEALTAFGGLSILVNNAGIVNFGRIDDYPREQWTRIIDVNLTGVFNGIQAAAPALATAGGASIINVSSIAGLRGYENLAGYTAGPGLDQERGAGPWTGRNPGQLRAPGCHPDTDDGRHDFRYRPCSVTPDRPARGGCAPGRVSGQRRVLLCHRRRIRH